MDSTETPARSFITRMDHLASSPWIVFLDNFMRRFFDILIASLGILFLLPALLVFAIMVKSDSPGPVFFRGSRVGVNGRLFKILKFRTMYEQPPENNGSPLTAKNDARITKVGRWLRDTKMNELPQLWNVLIGEMSFVGPRPEDPEFVNRWPEDIRSEILRVKPGITSPASVLYRDEERLLAGVNFIDDYLHTILPSKLRLDLLYIRNRNVFTDLDVIFLTLTSLLPRVEERQIPQDKLFWGPFSVFATRYLSWFLTDSLVAYLSVGVTGVIWRLSGPLELGWDRAIFFGLGIALLFSISNSLLGINRIDWNHAAASDVVGLGFSTLLATLALLLLNNILPLALPLPTAMLVVTGIICLIGFVLMRYRERLITGFASSWFRLRGNPAAIGERVLIVSSGTRGEIAAWFLNRDDLSHAFNIIGFIDNDPRKQGVIINRIPVLGTYSRLHEILKKMDIGLVLFAVPNGNDPEVLSLIQVCQNLKIRTSIFPDLTRQVQGSLEQSEFHAEPGSVPLPVVEEWVKSLAQSIDENDLTGARETIEKIKSHLDEVKS